jgi:hypothetical protein
MRAASVASCILLASAAPLIAFQSTDERSRDLVSCSGFQWGTFADIEAVKPIRVQHNFQGSIELDLGEGRDAQAIPDAAFQVCGKKTAYEIVSATSDRDGKFRMNLSSGRYKFVAAKPGFQSYSGTLIVSSWSFRRNIRIRLPLGL